MLTNFETNKINKRIQIDLWLEITSNIFQSILWDVGLCERAPVVSYARLKILGGKGPCTSVTFVSGSKACYIVDAA